MRRFPTLQFVLFSLLVIGLGRNHLMIPELGSRPSVHGVSVAVESPIPTQVIELSRPQMTWTAGRWYYSKNPSIAVVDPATGRIKPINHGHTEVCSQASMIDTTDVECALFEVKR